LGVAVGRVDAIRFPPAAALAAAADQRREGLNGELLQDVGEGVRRGARGSVKAQTAPDRALTALGVAPAEGAVAGQAPGGTPAR
jgi:hypothetical protein